MAPLNDLLKGLVALACLTIGLVHAQDASNDDQETRWLLVDHD